MAAVPVVESDDAEFRVVCAFHVARSVLRQTGRR